MKKIIAPLMFTLLAGCSATTNLEAIQSDVSIQVNDKPQFMLETQPERKGRSGSGSAR